MLTPAYQSAGPLSHARIAPRPHRDSQASLRQKENSWLTASTAHSLLRWTTTGGEEVAASPPPVGSLEPERAVYRDHGRATRVDGVDDPRCCRCLGGRPT